MPNLLLFDYLLRLGDTALIQGQRLSEWCGHAPSVEEDIALSNIALDLIGQSRYLLSLAGSLDGINQHDEDQLAFLRDEREFKNLSLVELPNLDFAQTILKVFLLSSYQMLQWESLQTSSLEKLAHIAEKSLKEAHYHQQYSSSWVIKLGDGTAISHQKTQAALNYLWTYLSEWFASDELEVTLHQQSICPLSAELKAKFMQQIKPILAQASLIIPADSAFISQGKQGLHTEYLGKILSEMQFLQRSYPNGSW